MSSLIAIVYPDAETAEGVRRELVQAMKEHLIQLEDAMVIERQPDGKIKLHQAESTVGMGAAGGALWGGLIGLLFLAPLFGMAIGAASGAVAGKLSDTGVNDDFMKQSARSCRRVAARSSRSAAPTAWTRSSNASGPTVVRSSAPRSAPRRMSDCASSR